MFLTSHGLIIQLATAKLLLTPFQRFPILARSYSFIPTISTIFYCITVSCVLFL